MNCASAPAYQSETPYVVSYNIEAAVSPALALDSAAIQMVSSSDDSKTRDQERDDPPAVCRPAAPLPRARGAKPERTPRPTARAPAPAPAADIGYPPGILAEGRK